MKKSKFDKVCKAIVEVSRRVLIVSTIFTLAMLLMGAIMQNAVFLQLVYSGAIIAMLSAVVFTFTWLAH